ncbi:MAG: hypothetical protein JRI95_12835 [Deltaproteobacteria bacterium]|nr:hypothetical protein [Deltaproteobacteria bacterium]
MVNLILGLLTGIACGTCVDRCKPGFKEPSKNSMDMRDKMIAGLKAGLG